MKKTIFAVIATILLCSCGDSTGGSEDTDAPIQVSINQTEFIVNRGDGFLVTEKPICQEGGQFSIVLDTGYYSLANGTLLTWGNTSCKAELFTGTSTSIEGSWQFSSLGAEIPGGASPTCEAEPDDMTGFSNLKTTLTFANNEVTTTGSADICMAQVMGQNDEAGETGMVADGCNRIKWTWNGDVATMQIKAFDMTGAMTVVFKFMGSECEMKTLAEVAPSQEACTYSWTKFVNEDDPDEEWDEEDFTDNPMDEALNQQWIQCVVESGFGRGGSSMLTKKALSKIKFPTKRFM